MKSRDLIGERKPYRNPTYMVKNFTEQSINFRVELLKSLCIVDQGRIKLCPLFFSMFDESMLNNL